MKCDEFEKMMPNFIDDVMEEEDYDEFIRHVKSCSACKDELEIHYMIYRGLDRIENDSAKSFDIARELASQLERYENRADLLFKHDVYRKVTFFVAELCALLTFIAQIVLILSSN